MGFRAEKCGFLAVALLLNFAAGCKSATPSAEPAKKPVAAAYPARPAVAPPAAKLFHHTDDSITLVTKEAATDDEIASLIWEVRDAAHTHTLKSVDASGVVQKMVVARKPAVWFHVYRGVKCAAEKYASGAPPCGGSYHAAGDYTYGDYVNHDWDDGTLRRNGAEVQLWDTEKPWVSPAAER